MGGLAGAPIRRDKPLAIRPVTANSALWR